MLNSAFITNTALFLPNQPIESDDMESVLGQAGSQPSRVRKLILAKNGIQKRYYAIDPKTGLQTHNNAEITAEAVRSLFKDTPEQFAQIDFLSCGTSSPDQVRPGHAAMVHGELKNPPCEIASFEGMCVTGVQALKSAYLSVASGESQMAVSTGSELISSFMRGSFFAEELKERSEQIQKTPILAFEKDFLRWMLSDGAAAVCIQPKPNKHGPSLKIEWIDILSFANEFEVCMYYGGAKNDAGKLVGYRDIPTKNWISESVFTIKQDVELLNAHIVDVGSRALKMIKEKRSFNTNEVTYFLPHMSSMFFMEKKYQRMMEEGSHIPMEKWFTNLPTVGNIGSAASYGMLDELVRTKKLNGGDKILLFIPESGRFSMAYILLSVV